MPNGIDTTGQDVAQAIISPDGRFLAAQIYTPGALFPTAPLILYNLEANSCCVYLENPTELPGWLIDLGGFNGDQLAISYLALNETATAIASGIMVVDALDGDLLYHFDRAAVETGVNFYVTTGRLVWMRVDMWDDEGLRFALQCLDCQNLFPPVQNFGLLTPRFDVYTPYGGEIFSSYGEDILRTTGEIIYLNHNANYSSAPTEGIVPPANVVEYSADADLPVDMLPHEVVFSDPAIDAIAWVMNGNAFVAIDYDTGTYHLQHRDLTTARYTLDSAFRFLSATETGWIVSKYVGEGSFSLERVTIAPDGTLSTARYDIAPADFILLREPVLNPASAISFEEATPPPVTPTRAVMCVSALLTPGSAAGVAGADVTVYEGASITSGPLGTLRANQSIVVLGGPVCEDDTVWWLVMSSDGLVSGYVQESINGRLLVRPLN